MTKLPKSDYQLDFFKLNRIIRQYVNIFDVKVEFHRADKIVFALPSDNIYNKTYLNVSPNKSKNSSGKILI